MIVHHVMSNLKIFHNLTSGDNDMQDFTNYVNELASVLKLEKKEFAFNKRNPYMVELFIDYCKYNYAQQLKEKAEAEEKLESLVQALNEFNTLQHNVTDKEIKEVCTLLKERKIHPKGEFDKRGRFYLDDVELVSVRSPSAKFPYSQMVAGRTRKFVNAMADKYKPQNKDELLKLFTTAN